MSATRVPAAPGVKVIPSDWLEVAPTVNGPTGDVREKSAASVPVKETEVTFNVDKPVFSTVKLTGVGVPTGAPKKGFSFQILLVYV